MSADAHEKLKDSARSILRDFKGDRYAFGVGCLDSAGAMAASLGRRALIIANQSDWMRPIVEAVRSALAAADVDILAATPGARPNSPVEDVYRMQEAVEKTAPSVVVAIGGGSTIDAVKSAILLACITPGEHEIESFFGVDRVSARLGGRQLTGMLAVQTSASSGAHLTRYSNITDFTTGQKKLVNDPAVIPPAAVFDYSVTATAPRALTIDGALDGISHCLEVYCGAKADTLENVEPVALAGIELAIAGVERACAEPHDLKAREMLGLGTDLGGCAIMKGSTNAAHLTSFSLVDVTSHARATAVLNPYYLVLFAEATGRQLAGLATLLWRAGYLKTDVSRLRGREAALAVGDAMQHMLASLGVETSLEQFENFSPAHIDRVIQAAGNPQLEMKLKAMPVPMDAGMVEHYMRGALEAAASGELERVETIPA